MNTKGLKVKADIKKHFVCGGVILLCYVYLLTHEISDAEVYGFWAGLWQGGIFLPKFIISLFLDNVKFIAKNRTLGYDIAFFFVNIVSLFYFVAVRGCVISLWRTLFVFSPFSRYGTEKIVFIYNKAQTFTSSGFAFPQKICIFAENFFKYGKDTNKI